MTAELSLVKKLFDPLPDTKVPALPGPEGTEAGCPPNYPRSLCLPDIAPAMTCLKYHTA